MIRTYAIPVLVALLAACGGSSPSDILTLRCSGQQAIDNQPGRPAQKLYRIDVRDGVLEDWNASDGRFVTWSDASVSKAGELLVFSGEGGGTSKQMSARRQVRFDPSTKRIRDQLEGSWGAAMAFEGSCAAVAVRERTPR